jgi:hypothetical protein
VWFERGHPNLASWQVLPPRTNDHIIVFVSSTGSFYAFTDPDDRLYSIGQTLGEAMERLLLGIGYGASIPRDA